MHAGPSLTPHIFDVFMRIRLQKIALIGALEKAFLNIGIKSEERDLLRFLWVDDIRSENPKLITLRFSRLVFGFVGSPFVLNATLRHHMEKYGEIDPEFVDQVQNSTYVDDFASSVPTDEEAFELFQKLKSRFKEGGFNMRKWASNSENLMSLIENQEFAAEKEKSDSISSEGKLGKPTVFENEIKVLGIPWNKNKDTLKFDLSSIVKDATKEPATKRILLSTIARFYDPHGLISPVILPLKMLFQEVCLMKVDWYSPLSNEINDRWKTIIDDINLVSEIEFPRCLLA